jgi:hypothetical protein
MLDFCPFVTAFDFATGFTTATGSTRNGAAGNRPWRPVGFDRAADEDPCSPTGLVSLRAIGLIRRRRRDITTIRKSQVTRAGGRALDAGSGSLQRAGTDHGGGTIEVEIHSATCPKLFRPTKPPLSSHQQQIRVRPKSRWKCWVSSQCKSTFSRLWRDIARIRAA